MTDPTEPTNLTPRPIVHPSGRKRGVSLAGAVLASGWLFVPTVQYVATAERTQYQLREVEEGATPPPVAEWDLTPLYLLLVFLTALFSLRAFFEHREGSLTEMDIRPVPGGAA